MKISVKKIIDIVQACQKSKGKCTKTRLKALELRVKGRSAKAVAEATEFYHDYIGNIVFASRIICDDCGCFYGSKV